MTSNPFMPGDLVRYVDNPYRDPSGSFTKGNIYRVGLRETRDERINLDISSGEGPYPHGWFAEHFELVYRPGDPETWKPKPGDPVRFREDGTYHDTTKVHHVIEKPTDGEDVTGAVWIDYGGGRGWNYARTWITWEGSLLTPMTHAEESTFAAPADDEEPKTPAPVEEVSTDDTAVESLKSEIEDLRVECRRQQERANAAEKKYDDFRTLVRDAVIEEADDRGWCEEVDDWLEKLGLEPRALTYDLPTNRYAVVSLTDGRIAVLEDTDWRKGVPWRAYDPKTGDGNWLSFGQVDKVHSRTLFLGDEEHDAVTEYE